MFEGADFHVGPESAYWWFLSFTCLTCLRHACIVTTVTTINTRATKKQPGFSHLQIQGTLPKVLIQDCMKGEEVRGL